MPNRPIEDKPSEAQQDNAYGLKAPEKLSMAYVGHLLNNTMASMALCIDYPDATTNDDLELTRQELIERINFLLKRYEQDLRNMSELRDFLELLRGLVTNNQFESALKLRQLGDRLFHFSGDLSKPGRHLSQETEAVESEPALRLTVADHCKNSAGLYVGLSKVQRGKLGVEIGGTVELFDDKNKSLGVFTVGTGSKEYLEMTDVFTANNVTKGEIVTVKKSVATPDKPNEFNLPVEHAVEKTTDPKRHAARKEKIAQRFPHSDPDMYITLPTAIASQLGIKPETGKTVAPISKCLVCPASGWDVQMVIVPTGTGIGFTSDAAEELDIPKELTEIRIIIDKGVLVIA